MQAIRSIAFLVGAAFTLLAVTLAYRALTKVPPGLVATPSVVTHERVGQSERVESHVQLRNNFSVPVRITEIRQSCGCLEVSPSVTEFQPGGQGDLKVVWNTGRARGTARVSVIVEYELKGGPLRAMKIPIQGVIEPDIEVEPSVVEIREGEINPQLIALSPGRLAQFIIREVSATHPSLVPTVGEDGRTVRVAFDAKQRGTALQNVDMEILIQTGSRPDSLIRVPVKVLSTP